MLPLTKYIHSKENLLLLHQFIRFGLVGIISTLTHVGTLMILVEIFKCPPIPASGIGFILAVIISYVLNYRYTFRASGSHNIYFPRYILVCIVGFAFNTTVMYLTVDLLKWWYMAGQILALFIVPISNFTLNRFWAFKNCRDSS